MKRPALPCPTPPCRAMPSRPWTVLLAVWLWLPLAGLPCQAQTANPGGHGADESMATSDDLTRVPEWSREAIWYQIFVERFRNGDASNDPVFENTEGAYPNRPFEGWTPTPWTHDWYRQEDWAAASGEEFYRTVQARRYGGDLQGVLDQLDYLEALGVTALYFNPINDAPSLHKYDARTYRHIDRHFGPDPTGDAEIMAAENPANPDTWQWTAADRLFLDLVAAVHERGMRIILDYSWNHTGITFWAWQDILENQADSPYADWYEIVRFDDPATGENEFEYEGWAGVSTLPNLKKVEVETKGLEGGNLHPAVKQHVYHVTRRWMDPNGDGDPSDGIDGFRLDVAEQVPKGFWREYRAFVRDLNPEAYLVGEVWWESWPDHMADPVPWVQGDVFDAVMNYRWYMPTRSFFAQAPPRLTATGYIAHLDSVERGIDRAHLEAMMNLGASHDSPRLGTSLYNRQTKYKYQAHPRGNPEYKIDRPDERTEAVRRLVLTQQFTYYGAPHIWNGDEVGMWGADDPDCRKPLVWEDLSYEDERAMPHAAARRADPVAPDLDLYAFIQNLARIRTAHTDLFVRGTLDYVLADDDRRLLAYVRALEDETALVAFNASDETHTAVLPVEGAFRNALAPETPALQSEQGRLTLKLAPLTAMILVRE